MEPLLIADRSRHRGEFADCAIDLAARAPLRLAFPAALAGRWMPGLFPEQAD